MLAYSGTDHDTTHVGPPLCVVHRPAAVHTPRDALAARRSQCAMLRLAPVPRARLQIGDWTVVDGEGHPTGTSTIRADLDGCAVIENWVSPDGAVRGRNVDAYNAEDTHWHRFFVDNRGHVHDFAGITTGAAVQYEGTSHAPDGADVRHRLTIRQDSPIG